MHLSYANRDCTAHCQLFVSYCVIILTVYANSNPSAQQLTVNYGHEVTLYCSVRNINKFAVWKCSGMCSLRANKTSESMISNGDIVAVNYREHVEMMRRSEKYDLYIKAVDELDAGNYTCTGGNGFGELVASVWLTVDIPVRSTPPPIKTQPPQTIDDGAMAAFSQQSTTGTATSDAMATATIIGAVVAVGVIVAVILIVIFVCKLMPNVQSSCLSALPRRRPRDGDQTATAPLKPEHVEPSSTKSDEKC